MTTDRHDSGPGGAPPSGASWASDPEQLSRLFQMSLDLLCIAGFDGYFRCVNPAWKNVLGYTAEELLGRPYLDLVHPDDRERTLREARRLASGSLTISFENRYRARDGSWRWLLWNSAPDPERRLIYAVARDMTERRQAEELLARARDEAARRRSEEHYRELVEHAALGIFRSRLDGRLLDANPALAAMLGYDSKSELLDKTMMDIYCDPAERTRIVEQYLRAGRIQGEEVDWRRRDGSRITVRITGRSAVTAESAVAEVEAIVEDVTERRQLERQLRQAQKMEAVGRLSGGVAHDFNNLLGVIIGYSDVLLEELGPGHRLHKPVAQIKQAGERAAALTRQLLAFSRQQVLQPRPLNLNAVVESVARMLQRLIGEDIRLETRLASAVGTVRADPGQIEQVLMNLAVNARDAMPHGGRLLIETDNAEFDEAYARSHPAAQPGHYALLAVSDTGCGMDAETQSHIFEPFFTTKEPGKGTGLGLATVYGVIKQSGGYIWVYSEPGQGSTFKIYLPLVPGPAEPPAPPAPPRRTLRGAETVLVVEDDTPLRDFTRDCLERCGYRVLLAQNPQEALDAAALYRGPIHLLLTDVVMPGMSGYDLARQFATRRPDMRVLYVSGYTDHAAIPPGRPDTAGAFLPKPFTLDALARKVRDVLDAAPARRL